MVTKTVCNGNVMRYEKDSNEWVVERKVKCRCNETIPVMVTVPKDLSSTKKQKWKQCKIDKCIAPIVQSLQSANIDMRGSCCGHGEIDGYIQLQDGRVLIVKNNGEEYIANL